MARTWLSIRVELIQGRGERYWPRPGRLFAASRSHTFEQLSTAINDAFARWDQSHLWAFRFANELRIDTVPEDDWEQEESLNAAQTKLSRLEPGEQFAYEYDFGDSWLHLCTVDSDRVDPEEILGILPRRPLPYWGWGNVPDQYGRRWEDDDGEGPIRPDPGLSDLPPLHPYWETG